MKRGDKLICIEGFTFWGQTNYRFKEGHEYIVKMIFDIGNDDDTFAVYNPKNIAAGSFILHYKREKNFVTLKQYRKLKLEKIKALEK